MSFETLAFIYMTICLFCCVYSFFDERKLRKAAETREEFAEKVAENWHSIAYDCLDVAKGGRARVQHIETGEEFIVYGDRVNEANSRLELLVYMRWPEGGEFAYLDASWFEPLAEFDDGLQKTATADVVSRKEVERRVDCVLVGLTAVHQDDDIPDSLYSMLYDLVAGIVPEA